MGGKKKKNPGGGGGGEQKQGGGPPKQAEQQRPSTSTQQASSAPAERKPQTATASGPSPGPPGFASKPSAGLPGFAMGPPAASASGSGLSSGKRWPQQQQQQQPQYQQRDRPQQQSGRPQEQPPGSSAWGRPPPAQQQPQQQPAGPPQKQQQPQQQPAGPPQKQQQPAGPPQKQQQPPPERPAVQQQQGGRPQQSSAWGRPSPAQQQPQQQPAEPPQKQQQPPPERPAVRPERQRPTQQQAAKPQQKAEVRPRQAAADGDGDKNVTSGKPTDSLAEMLKGLEIRTMPPRQVQDQKKKSGRRIMVDTNHLPLVLKKKDVIAYHYDVAFNPDKPKFMLRRALNEVIGRHFGQRKPSFDGRKNLYSNGPLPKVGEGELADDVELTDENDRKKTFQITIKLVNKVNLSRLNNYLAKQDSSGADFPQDAVAIVDIVLRNHAANTMVQAGRLFFTPPKGSIYSLGEGLDLWYGFYQSAILGWKPYVNVDVAHKGFPTPCNLLDTIREVCGCDPADSRAFGFREKETLQKYIKRLKVEYELPNLPSSRRTFKVNGLKKAPKEENFKLDNGTTTNVLDYFRQEKKYNIRFPHLPTLWVGSLAKVILVPLELCRIAPNQVVNGKMTERQTANMVRKAATSTYERRAKIEDVIGSAKYSGNPYMEEFGLSVSGKFETVEARVLDAPKLEYNANRQVNVSRGVWRGERFLQPQPLNNWRVLNLNFRTRPDEIQRLESSIIQQGNNLGMAVQKPLPHVKIDDRRGDREILNFFEENQNLDIVFVVVPDKGDVYSKVKKFAEINVGVLTQCVKGGTVFKLKPTTVDNILLKVNAKLNGVNQSIAAISRPECLKRPAMVVGADVTHPSPDSTNIPSVAAVAASHDPKAFKYNMLWRLQDPRDEMIRDLEAIMIEQLRYFHKTTNYKPERILFFRDGVSDGQINEVFNVEFQAIRRACKALQGEGYEPKITFVIVQKRHHTRFFPTNERDIDDKKNFNVPAGTCVDTDIVHPREHDFYLVSHASIQGTARPTKYRLVWDDSNMSEEELEKLTYYLCHLFSRCTRSVSYPAPTYNAHLAAFRARVYLEGDQIGLDRLDREQANRQIKTVISKNKPMFFV